MMRENGRDVKEGDVPAARLGERTIGTWHATEEGEREG